MINNKKLTLRIYLTAYLEKRKGGSELLTVSSQRLNLKKALASWKGLALEAF